MDEERRREVGLFRYSLVRDAADPGLSKAERGRLVRALCGREHLGPDGRLVPVSRAGRGLREQGLIFDAADPEDGRRRVYRLSPVGEDVVADYLRAREDRRIP